ncbi:MAG: aa3-type cytochrome c oxidase subunit IV [Mesorhizobium amorphae]|nr:MAG: aa3-type cytochrome c oxidase subunit IV [Mesorhizobium amorphae]
MAEHPPSGPLEMGAKMDYAEHTKTYDRFLILTKYGTIAVVALLVAMAFGLLGGGGFISSVILFVLLVAVASFAMR